jgi:acetyl esterase
VAVPAISDELRGLMAEIGPRWNENATSNVKLMVERFTPLLRQASDTHGAVTRNIVFGAHLRHRLDVFAPKSGKTARPALVFVHGGAFVEGDRDRTDQVYSNVLHYFARHDIVGFNVEYRLAPEAKHPDGSHDVGAAVAWVKANASSLNVDASQIFLMGHSAGGAHCGSYAYDRRLWPPGGTSLAGLIIVSGRVRADNLPENHNARKVEAYYGADASLFDGMSPVSHVSSDSVPTFVAWSEFENPLLDVYCSELVYRLGVAKRRTPPSLWLKGHNHTSIIAHINTAEDTLGRAILGFINDRVLLRQ